ncbi:MAG: hypothetical protein V5A56_12320 [Halolamina sp.]
MVGPASVAPFASLGSVPAVVPASAAALPLQASVVSVLGTYLLFALFLSLTAFLAARNVLGDVPWRRYLVVGPPLAAIAFLSATFGLNPYVALLTAVLIDAGLIARLHAVRPRLLAAITLIHFVVSVLLGAVVFGIVTLVGTMPG